MNKKKKMRGKNKSNNDIHTGEIINTIKAINEILTEIRFSFFKFIWRARHRFNWCEQTNFSEANVKNSRNIKLGYESDEDKLHLPKFQLISLPLCGSIFHLLFATRQV